MGMNFYGNDFLLPYGGGPILSDTVKTLLQTHQAPMTWSPASHEHYFEYLDDDGMWHRVFYPTIKARKISGFFLLRANKRTSRFKRGWIWRKNWALGSQYGNSAKAWITGWVAKLLCLEALLMIF